MQIEWKKISDTKSTAVFNGLCLEMRTNADGVVFYGSGRKFFKEISDFENWIKACLGCGLCKRLGI